MLCRPFVDLDARMKETPPEATGRDMSKSLDAESISQIHDRISGAIDIDAMRVFRDGAEGQ